MTNYTFSEMQRFYSDSFFFPSMDLLSQYTEQAMGDAVIKKPVFLCVLE